MLRLKVGKTDLSIGYPTARYPVYPTRNHSPFLGVGEAKFRGQVSVVNIVCHGKLDCVKTGAN